MNTGKSASARSWRGAITSCGLWVQKSQRLTSCRCGGGLADETLVEVATCRGKLREADVILAQVRGAFIVAPDAAGARLANDAVGLIADLMRMLDAEERRLTGQGRG